MTGDAGTTRPAPPVTFWFDGEPYQGYAGEPLAVALWRAGVRQLGWQEDRNTPRGLYCAIGHCFECRVTVDGARDRRACLEPVRAGLKAERQAPPPPLRAVPLEEVVGDVHADDNT